MSDWFALIHTVSSLSILPAKVLLDSMGSYILGLQDDFVRSLEFVTLFEFVNELK
ncbi:hypothetical protein LEP1GSC125_1380 [Leptospira mayottensis 200901122]|uniref:Uncharacterized protein n=1 Tax=Leptospira mayottensis 200901122 TaxID=1193010 RepID=A0AA87SX44_9LEPT|nr:hypothetical protein LEP1GSC125_1380 [Leptospira mayottensis 200901122]